MIESSAIQALTAFHTQLDAFNSGDLERFLSTYARDVILQRDDGPAVRGAAEMRELYTARFADPALSCHVKSVAVSGERFVVAHEIVSTSAGRTEVQATFECEGTVIVRAMFMTRSMPAT